MEKEDRKQESTDSPKLSKDFNKVAVSRATKTESLIRLNIGGWKYSTTRETLSRISLPFNFFYALLVRASLIKYILIKLHT
jgi:hypothetical protein